jgi:hypothetical protein
MTALRLGDVMRHFAKTAWVTGSCLLATHVLSAAPTFGQQGTSSARVEELAGHVLRTTITNTTFLVDDGPIDRRQARHPAADASVPRGILFRISQKTSRLSGEEKGSSTLDLEASDARSRAVLWRLQDRADRYELHSECFLMSTIAEGCCGSQNSYRAFSELTGTLLFPYSFTTKASLPVVLRAGAFDPEMLRFVAYQGNYWPARDKSAFADPEGKLSLAGVVTYASTSRAIQKLAIFVDEKAQGDPPSDPDRIEVVYGGQKWVFDGADAKSAEEASYWNRGAKDAAAAFSGLTVNVVWGDEGISFPITNDQVEVARIRAGNKVYLRVVPLPAKYWATGQPSK